MLGWIFEVIPGKGDVTVAKIKIASDVFLNWYLNYILPTDKLNIFIFIVSLFWL